MKIILTIVLLQFSCFSCLYCQNIFADSTNKKTLLWTATLSGGVNVNQHSADFSGMPGVPSCCPNYSDGNGTGISIAGKFALPVGRSMFAGLRVGFTTLNGSMTTLQTQTIDNNGIATGLFEHSIVTKISMLTFEPTASILLWKSLRFHGGLSIAAVTSATYDQSETLLSPSDVVFENDSRVRNKYSGDISQVPGLQAGLTGELSYDIPLSHDGSFSLTPEVDYTFGLTNIVSTSDLWKINTLRFSLGITYNFFKLPPLGTGMQLEAPPDNSIPSKR